MTWQVAAALSPPPHTQSRIWQVAALEEGTRSLEGQLAQAKEETAQAAGDALRKCAALEAELVATHDKAEEAANGRAKAEAAAAAAQTQNEQLSQELARVGQEAARAMAEKIRSLMGLFKANSTALTAEAHHSLRASPSSLTPYPRLIPPTAPPS
jgi:dGTP triphosphohydrolase